MPAGYAHQRPAVVLCWAKRGDGLSLVRRRLMMAQAAYAVAALVSVVSPVASIVALALVRLFFVVSPRIPFRA